MKLENLQKLAAYYKVPLFAVLLAPENTPKASGIRRAASLAEALSAWLAAGEQMAKRHPEK